MDKNPRNDTKMKNLNKKCDTQIGGKTPREFCEVLPSVKASVKHRSLGICENEKCNNKAKQFAHIHSADKDGPHYDPELTIKYIMSESNCKHLCIKCHRAYDKRK